MSEPVEHPECAKMHAHGYCVCTMVQCISCEKFHPPHKLNCQPAREIVPLPKEDKP